MNVEYPLCDMVDACMALLPALESLVNTLVPQSNFDEELTRRLVERCQEILSRHAPCCSCTTLVLIGRSPSSEESISDAAQLAEQIKQKRMSKRMRSFFRVQLSRS